MESSWRYVGSSCGLAVPPVLANWEVSRGAANNEAGWWEYNNGAAAAATHAHADSAELLRSWRRHDLPKKNDLCPNFVAALQRPQQCAPTLLTLQIDRATDFAPPLERQGAEHQRAIPPQQVASPTAISSRDREGGSVENSAPEYWKSLLCGNAFQARQHWQSHSQLLGRREQREVQQDSQSIVGSCPAGEDIAATARTGQAHGRPHRAASAAAIEAARGLLTPFAVSGASPQSSNRELRTGKASSHCIAGFSDMEDGPAANDCSGAEMSVAAACAESPEENTIVASSDRNVRSLPLSEFLRSESSENFLESAYRSEDSSGSGGCCTNDKAACESSFYAANQESSGLSSVAVSGAAAADDQEETRETGVADDREPYYRRANVQREDGLQQPQPQKRQQHLNQQEQWDQPEWQQEPQQPAETGSRGAVQKTEMRQQRPTLVMPQPAFDSGPPGLLREARLVSQMRVVQRDPKTGAAEERVVQVLLIHRNPEIFYIPDLLTDAECDHLIQISRGRWERSKTSTGYATAEQHEFSSMNSANRTSSSVPLAIGETLGVENVERLAAAFAEMDVAHLEPLVVVRYEPGQCFKAHHDGGFRPKTLLLYLNDVEEGGETSFEHLGFCISPAKRAGVLWANAYPGTNIIDPRMLHSGLPPQKGIKYVVNCFFNKHPVRGRVP